MRRSVKSQCGMIGLLLLAITGFVARAEPVVIEYFHQPGCPDCLRVTRDVLPDVEAVFPEQYRLHSLDITVRTNALRMIMVQESLGVWDNEPVSMLVDGRFYLAGFNAIRDNLVPAIQKAMDARLPGDHDTADVVDDSREGASAVERRVTGFTVAGVMIAGLVDSLNPCAISMLVFFVSVLSVARVRGRRLVMAGVAFIGASYATYFLLGLGLLSVLRAVTAISALKVVVDTVMIVVLVTLAGLSVRDALAFHRSGNPADVRVQLPSRLKEWSHRIAREGVRTHRLLVAAVLIGGGVTLLESVCTGQVYVPALALMARTGRSLPRVLGLLGLYNLMFVMPLIVVFALVAKGLETPVLLAWSKRHVTPAKFLLAGLFLTMALLIYWL